MNIAKTKIVFLAFVLFVITGLALVRSQEPRLSVGNQGSERSFFEILPLARYKATPQPSPVASNSSAPDEEAITRKPTPTALSSLKPVVASLSPGRGRPGTVVTITGSGFLPTGNTVVATMEEFHNVTSSDGSTLKVTLQGPPFFKDLDSTVINFYNTIGAETEYWIVVRNKNGDSNFLPFILQLYE